MRHGTCFHRRLATRHAGAAPHSAVAELGVVRRHFALSMIRVVLLLLFVTAPLVSHAQTAVSATQNGRPITIVPDVARRLEHLATAVLVSSDYEAPSTIANKARWTAALRGSHVSLTFTEPRTFSFSFSTTGPATEQVVSADQILIPASPEHGPDYILVRFHDRIRAFAKFSGDADRAFRREIPSTPNQ